jgi:hypothetical protein
MGSTPETFALLNKEGEGGKMSRAGGLDLSRLQ